MSTDANDFAVAKKILKQSAPLVARDLVSITLASEDPDDHRRYLELIKKLDEKDDRGAGAIVNFTIDMSGFSAVTTPAPEVIEADDLRQDGQPLLPDPAADPLADQDVLDLSDLLAINDPVQVPA
jgi:hypothetical protein